MAQQSGETTGLLRITTGAELGTIVVDAWIARFLRKAPKVTLEGERNSSRDNGV